MPRCPERRNPGALRDHGPGWDSALEQTTEAQEREVIRVTSGSQLAEGLGLEFSCFISELAL